MKSSILLLVLGVVTYASGAPTLDVVTGTLHNIVEQLNTIVDLKVKPNEPAQPCHHTHYEGYYPLVPVVAQHPVIVQHPVVMQNPERIYYPNPVHVGGTVGAGTYVPPQNMPTPVAPPPQHVIEQHNCRGNQRCGQHQHNSHPLPNQHTQIVPKNRGY